MSLSLRFCLRSCYVLCSGSFNVLSHIFHIDVNFGQELQIIFMCFSELQIKSLSIPMQNALWHARIGIFNLNRTYRKNIKVNDFNLMKTSHSFRYRILRHS